MKRNRNAKRLGTALSAALLGALLLLAGCKDLFHPEGPEEVYYTVTFNADGGSFSGGSVTQTRTVAKGGSVGASNMPSEPTKSGGTVVFDGWYASQNGGGSQFTASTTVNADITAYARWTTLTTPSEYSLMPNSDPQYDGYVAQAANLLPEGFAVSVGDQIEISFWIKTSANITGFAIGIADWANSGGGWVAEYWGDPKSIAADGQFHRYTWTATAQSAGPVGSNSLIIHFATEKANVSMVTIYVSNVSVRNRSSSCTVTFNADGGTPSPQTRTVEKGGSVGSSNMPSDPTKSDNTFGGWYTAQNGGGLQFTASTTVTADITVYAKWVAETAVSAPSLQQALAWLASNAVSDRSYTYTLSTTESIGPQTLSYSGKNVSLTLRGESTEQMVVLISNGSLFTVGSGVTLRLGENVALQGRGANTSSLVSVSNGGTLVMESGSKITGNTASSSSYPGGGVYVNGGTFTMSGGAISGNTSSSGGGGVFVASSGTFTMSGGAIGGNTASGYNSSSSGSGGGVYAAGTFIKQSGGTIYGSNADVNLKNTAYSNTYGHAVYVSATKKRDSTAGVGVTMNSSLTGASGGWADQWTVTFDAGGDSPATLTVNSGASVGSSMPTEPTRSGYRFYGWWTAQNGGGTEFAADTEVTEDITLYAKWVRLLGSVQINLQPVSSVSTLSNTIISVSQSAQFSVDSGYDSYTWYWNGEAISGAASNAYSLAANSTSAGIYELSVFVTTSTGETLSARCHVSITK